MSCQKIIREDAGRAIDALLGFLRARSKQQKAQLFEHDDFIYLHLNSVRFPSTSRTNPYQIPLPHSLHPLDPSRTSLCLIADDSLAESARSVAIAEKLPFDSIIPLSELRTDYVPFESRRRLCDSYDIFFAERRIITLLPRLIGNYFFKKRKIPVGINLCRKGWPEAVRKICGSTLVFLGSGTSIGMKVGRVSMDREEIVDNLMIAIEGAVNLVPKKWENVRCMYVKSVQSVALPIYQFVPQMGMKIDGVVVQERGGKSGVEKERNGKRRAGSKKRKGRIHDVDFVGGELVDGNAGDVDREGAEEEENDVSRLGKKNKKNKDGKVKLRPKKDGKRKLSKGKKVVIDDDDLEKKENGDQFIEFDTMTKMRKRAKKIENSEVEKHDIRDGLKVDTIIACDKNVHSDDKEHLQKMKAKRKEKKINCYETNKDKKNLRASDEANVMKGDATLASSTANDGDPSNVLKIVKKDENIDKDKKIKRVKKNNLR